MGDLIEKKTLDKKFWNNVDNALNEFRKKYQYLSPEEQDDKISRSVVVYQCTPPQLMDLSRYFASALRVHLKKFPPKKGTKPKAVAHRALPTWQKELSRTVNEMKGYSQVDLEDIAEDDGAVGSEGEGSGGDA